MNIWAIIPLATSIVYLVLLLFISQQAQKRANKLFAYYIGIAAFWSFSSFMLHLDGVTDSQTLLWNQILVVALVWALIAYYHFIKVYTKQKSNRGLFAGYLILIVIAVFSFSGNVVDYAEVREGLLNYSLGNSLFFIIAISLTFAAAIFIRLFKKYRASTDPIDRNRTAYLLAGWSVLVVLTLTNAIPAWRGLPLDHIGNLINAFIISYAISRFHLLNIRMVVRRGLAYAILALFIVSVSVLYVRFGYSFFEGQSMITTISVSTIFILLLVFAARPLTRLLEVNIDRLFYQTTYDVRQALLSFSDKMGNILDLDELAKELLPSVVGTLKISKTDLLFQDNQSGDFVVAYSYPEPDEEDESKFVLSPDNPIITWLDKNNNALYLDNIDNIPELTGLWQEEKKQLEKSGLGMLYPIKNRDKLVSILSLGKKESQSPYSYEDMQLLNLIGSQAGIIIENAMLYQQAETRANTDELTGLLNHRAFHERIEEEIARGSRFGGSFSLIMMDIDLFKTYNDIYGHLAGDQILRKVGRYLESCIRSIDLPFRYGGEEFAVILPEARLDDAYKVAERIRKTIESQTSSRSMPITLSLGVGNWPNDGVMKEEVIGIADDALYRAKQTGRNRTCLSSDVLKPETSLIGVELESKPRALSIIYALAATVDAKDSYTYGHSKKVSEYAVALSENLKIPQDKLNNIRAASLLHDIGKVGVPDSILNKKEPLTDEEWNPIRGHPKLGVEILRHVMDLAHCLPAILHHHEHYDGSGYPSGLKGDKIPLEARILSVADSYDAMTSPRPYREQLSMEDAVKELKRCAGKQFDPEIVDMFCDTILPKQHKRIEKK
ncbi:MAG: diguanylate cyclase [Dehalococcoidia bacterium]|nr:MAG: diguanylate cyclase [Dehalococcoidia bacterium]